MADVQRGAPRQMTPQEKQRLDAMKKSWQRQKAISAQLKQIKVRLGVYSGKGGVGKTTVTVNLAANLASRGYKVGLLDADIDCPNVPKLLGVPERPAYINGRILPSVCFGFQVVSMAFFQEHEDEAIIWRGPMIHNAINQFLEVTDWGELDFLLIDLPPGTSDAPLTVMQLISPDGFVVVATPQELAKLDAKRSINMIKKMNIRVMGVVENFSGDMFGAGAGEELSEELGIPFLGRFQLRQDYRDTSKPAVLASNAIRQEYDYAVANLLPLVEDLLKGKEQD
ncbi:MAG: ATP-binding protein involved in chromosome partitioning [Chloroflexi bacterium]|jgi:Mrp family chromosome partitioning ATPase|nr:MAG: ATP-binding protein involved in chromosome partitioning [Chloroflexota bacterium]